MIKVCLALVHNNNNERLNYILGELNDIKGCFGSKKCDIELIQVAYQPDIIPHSRLRALLRDFIYQIVGYEWACYRFKRQSLLILVFNLIKLIFKKSRYSIGSSWRRSSAIEVEVTDKHVRAWSMFLDTDFDFLIMFEDDAVFNIDSKQRLSDLLDGLMLMDLSGGVYVDLAGGCPLDSLGVDQLLLKQDSSFRYYEKPVTNTACAYLINKPLAVQFHKVLTNKPWFRLIGVDWMMNALFINLVRNGVDCVCMHAEPAIFKHGSTTGEYLPWSR